MKPFAYRSFFIVTMMLLAQGDCLAQFRPRKTLEDEKKIPEVVNFGGFEFGSAKRGYITRELGGGSAIDPKNHESGWYDKFYDHEVIVGGDYNDEGLLYKVYFSPNCATWCTTNEEFHEEIHKVIDKLEEYNGGTLYGWPTTPFVNVVPPNELLSKDMRLKDLWDLVQGEFCKNGLRRFEMHAISESGIMLSISVTIPRKRGDRAASYWTVVMIKPGLFRWGYNSYESFYKGFGERIMRKDASIVCDQGIIGFSNPKKMIAPEEDNSFWRYQHERGEWLIRKLKIRMNERDCRKYIWQAPKEIIVNGEAYLLDFNGKTGSLTEKNSGRRLQIHFSIIETAGESDSVRHVCHNLSCSSMPDEAIILGKEVIYKNDMIIIKGGGQSRAILKNLVLEVNAESESELFAETILRKGSTKLGFFETLIRKLSL